MFRLMHVTILGSTHQGYIYLRMYYVVQDKDKFHPRTEYEAPEAE